jgi:hypothetical protein
MAINFNDINMHFIIAIANVSNEIIKIFDPRGPLTGMHCAHFFFFTIIHLFNHALTLRYASYDRKITNRKTKMATANDKLEQTEHHLILITENLREVYDCLAIAYPVCYSVASCPPKVLVT